MKVAVIAPYHLISDYRVLRSLRAFDKLECETDILYDLEYGNNEFLEFDLKFKSVKLHKIKCPKKRFLKLKLPNICTWINKFGYYISNADFVYIHDSGITGLKLSKYIKQKYSKRIIFDYHDSIDFEYFYQLSKFKLEILYPITKFIYHKYLQQFSNYVDYTIGISRKQLGAIHSIFNENKPSFVVPNTRKNVKSYEYDHDDHLRIVWIGTVMRGRDLERLIKLSNNINIPGLEIDVFGYVLSPDLVDDLKKDSKYRINFHGKYNDDSDIVNKISGKSFGIFMGWNDPYNTRINEISSPNKFFSYINVGIPVLIDSKLVSVGEILSSYNGGQHLKCDSEYFARVTEISDNYKFYQANVIKIKRSLDEDNLINDLANYISKVSY